MANILCIQIGEKALAEGFCCIAIGDGAVARGRFEISIKESISIDPFFDKNHVISSLRKYSSIYRSIIAPPEFYKNSTTAIEILIEALNSASNS